MLSNSYRHVYGKSGETAESPVKNVDLGGAVVLAIKLRTDGTPLTRKPALSSKE